MKYLFFVILIVVAGNQCFAQKLEKEENTRNFEEQLFGTDEKMAFSLVGTIYYLPKRTSRLPLNFDKYEAVGKVYVNKLDIPTRSFSTGFPGITDRFEWFAIDYHGAFLIDSAQWFDFALFSDDGSKLFIDGKLVVNNDGNHAPIKATGKHFLREGFHTMNVQYFQGPRDMIALRLLYKSPHETQYKTFNFDVFSPLKVKKEAETEVDSSIVSIEINSSVLFDFDEFNLKEEAKLVLDEIVEVYLADSKVGVIIEGHTDNVGEIEYNYSLALNRAQSVKTFLGRKHLINTQVWIKSYGELKPKYDNDTEAGRSKNRRVELHIMPPDKIEEFLQD